MVVSSCTYSPEGEYFEEIEIKTPEVSFSLKDYPETDTIFVFEQTKFDFDIDVGNLSVKQVNIWLGNRVIYNSNNTKGIFWIANENLETGIYELKIETITKSGTGSLADKLEQEILTLWRKWIITIDVTIPDKPILMASNANGFLKLSWTPYTRKNFQSYKLWIDSNFPKAIDIFDPDVNFYIDSTKLWLIDNYQLYTYTNTNSNFSELLEGNGGFNPIIETNLKDSTVILKWNKIDYKAAFKEIIIRENDEVRSIINTSDDTSSTIKLKPILGKNSTVLIQVFDRIRPINYNLVSQYSTSIANPLGARRTFQNQRFFYSEKLAQLVSQDAYQKFRIYDSNMKVIDSLHQGYLYRMPAPGEFAYFIKDQSIVQFNILTKEKKSFNLFSKTTTPFTLIRYSAANNGLISYDGIEDYGFFGYAYRSVIADVNSGQIVKIIESNHFRGTPYPNDFYSLSHDGQFAFKGSDIIDLRNNSFLVLGNTGGRQFTFREDMSEELILINYPFIEIYKTVDQTKQRTLPSTPDGFTFKNYDPATKILFFTNDQMNLAYLINIESGDRREINCDCASFYNGILFSKDGSYLKIM